MQDNFELPENLRKDILLSIQHEEYRHARRMFVVSIVAAPVSVVGIIWSVQYALTAFYQSSFYTYFSLIFSDTAVVALYWKEFTFMLAESLPVVGVILCLIATGALLVSIQLFARNVRFGLTPSFTN